MNRNRNYDNVNPLVRAAGVLLGLVVLLSLAAIVLAGSIAIVRALL